MSTKRKNNKGFTLVELIVVLVILAILAAILVPALLGYIDRSKNQQYITEARDLMMATQAGIAEAYAFRPVSFEDAVRTPASGAPVKVDYGYYSNYYLYKAKMNKLGSKEDGVDKGEAAKKMICNRVVEYADSVDFSFADALNDNHKVSDLGNKVGFVIFFNDRGKILYMQYARDGHLVTFDGSSFEVETGDNLTFVKFRNPK